MSCIVRELSRKNPNVRLFTLTELDWFLKNKLYKMDSKLYKDLLSHPKSEMDLFSREYKIMVDGIVTTPAQYKMEEWLQKNGVLPLFFENLDKVREDMIEQRRIN